MSFSNLYKGENIIRIVFFLLILAGGAFVCGSAVQDYANARDSVSWPSVKGVVLQDDGRATRYAYSWQGRNHEAVRRRFITGYRMSDFTRSKIAASGPFVSVYVSPDHPTVTVLEPGGSRHVFAIILGCGAVLVFVGGGGFVRSLVAQYDGPDLIRFDITSANQYFFDD